MQMYCSQCGLDRTVPNNAADPGACPQCGNTARCSWKPQWPKFHESGFCTTNAVTFTTQTA